MRAFGRRKSKKKMSMSNLRPVLITIDYPPDRGGVARYLSELVRASHGGIDVVVPLSHAGSRDSTVTSRPLFQDQWPRWFPMIRVCRGFRSKASCLLVSHILPVGTAAMIARWFGGPRFVLLLHGLDAQRAYEHPFKRWIARMVLRSASAVVVNSKTTGSVVQRLFGSSVRVRVITPGVSDMTFVSRETARARLDIDPKEYVILAISRLVERKGLDTLIEAVKGLPPADAVRLVIVGDGPEERALRDLAQKSPHPVQFISRASDEHKAEWLAAANVFCMPVKDIPNDMEGFGIVLLEGALAGLPVIAGRAGGTEEAVVDRETGFIVNGSDPREVARALMLLLGDPEKQRMMGEAGRKRALADFRWEDRWKSFQDIFDHLV